MHATVLGFGNLSFRLSGISGYEIINSIDKLDLKPEIPTEFQGELSFVSVKVGTGIVNETAEVIE